ncbi:MAG: glycoside hydrolase family 38 C-terminal domain-containing protein [Planctomycetota bacterium]
MSAPQALQTPAAAPASTRTLHLICQSHLDPVWLWPVRDGIAEALTTMQSAVDRAEEFPQFKYTRSSAATYRWLEKMDPRLFARVKRLIDEGRWEVVGGWVEQPDCNLPSGESFIRQAWCAKRYLRETFGERGVSKVAYVPDSFGHAGGLPQLLRATGFEAYAFMRPYPQDHDGIAPLFQWESPDGSRVLGIHIVHGYSQSYASTADDIEASIRKAVDGSFAPGFSNGIMWLGVGNHGGSLTREHLERVLSMQGDETLPELRFSTVADFIAAAREEAAFADLPVWKGEIGYPFRGCYSATGEVKADNRAGQAGLFGAEALAALRGVSDQNLGEAWWKLAFNQFHDILAGTCTSNTQDETRRRYGYILDTAEETRFEHAVSIARGVDTTGERGVVCVVNPLPWARQALIAYDTFTEPHGIHRITHLESQDGRTIYPVQWQQSHANFGPWGMNWKKLTALMDVPAGGHAVYRIADEPIASQGVGGDEVDESNPQFAGRGNQAARGPIAVTKDHAVPSLKTPSGAELLEMPVDFVVLDDPSDTWGMEVESLDNVVGEPERVGSQVLESGPVLTTVRQKWRWNRSEVWLDATTYTGVPGVELTVKALWLEARQTLKLRVRTHATGKYVAARMPAEVVTRPADGNEYACHGWLAMEADIAGKPVTLGLMNTSSHSYDAKPGQLRMIVARAVPHAEHPPFFYKDLSNQPLLDQGWLTRRFGLLATDGGWEAAGLERRAMELEVPVEVVPDSGHPGTRAWSEPGLSVEPAGVAVHAVRPSASGEGLVVRLQELTGQPTDAQLRWQGGQVTQTLQPWELVTLRLQGEGAALTGERLTPEDFE